MARKTEGVFELVQHVLRTFSEPYSEDIIEDVFLAIENTIDWRMRYDELGDELSYWVVNNWIGKYTKQITGLKGVLQVNAKRSKITTSYTKLVPR